MNPITRSGAETTQDRIDRLREKGIAKDALLVAYRAIEVLKSDPTVANAIALTYALYPNYRKYSGQYESGCAILHAHGAEKWSCNKCRWSHNRQCDLLSLVSISSTPSGCEDMLGRILMAAIEMQVIFRIHPAFAWAFMGMP